VLALKECVAPIHGFRVLIIAHLRFVIAAVHRLAQVHSASVAVRAIHGVVEATGVVRQAVHGAGVTVVTVQVVMRTVSGFGHAIVDRTLLAVITAFRHAHALAGCRVDRTAGALVVVPATLGQERRKSALAGAEVALVLGGWVTIDALERIDAHPGRWLTIFKGTRRVVGAFGGRIAAILGVTFVLSARVPVVA